MRYQGVNSAFWRLEIATRPTGERFFVHEADDVAVVLQKSVDAYFADEMQTSLFAYGNPVKAAEILKNLRAEYKRPDSVMISEEIFSELDRESRDFYGPHWGFSWEFFFAEEPLEEVPGQAEVRFISASSSEFEKYSAEIKEVLEGANPITDALENFSKLDWYAHFSEEGKITSVMGIEYHDHAIHFSGLGTNPLYRGKGYGSAVMVEAINDSLRRGHQAIYFGMWDWNQGARKLYRKLGIDSGGVLILGDSQPFEELSAKLTDA